MKARVISLVLVLILSTVVVYAKSSKTENRFQIGIGISVSTNNLLGLIESVKMYEAFESKKSDYSFIGISADDQTKLKAMDPKIQRAVMIANLFGAMEYGIQLRMLYKALMLESNLMFLPFDGTYNGRFDMMLTVNAGLRAPFWIMPYFLAGVNFTFSFYPGKLSTSENWKKKWGATDSFVWRPGVNLRLGLDIKFKGLSIGAYYQYTVKDFEEFSSLYSSIEKSVKESNAQYVQAQAFGMLLGAQSRFGASICLYLF